MVLKADNRARRSTLSWLHVTSKATHAAFVGSHSFAVLEGHKHMLHVGWRTSGLGPAGTLQVSLSGPQDSHCSCFEYHCPEGVLEPCWCLFLLNKSSRVGGGMVQLSLLGHNLGKKSILLPQKLKLKLDLMAVPLLYCIHTIHGRADTSLGFKE